MKNYFYLLNTQTSFRYKFFRQSSVIIFFFISIFFINYSMFRILVIWHIHLFFRTGIPFPSFSLYKELLNQTSVFFFCVCAFYSLSFTLYCQFPVPFKNFLLFKVQTCSDTFTYIFRLDFIFKWFDYILSFQIYLVKQ